MYIHSMFSSRKGLRQDLSVYMVNMVIVGLEITSFLSIQSIFNQSMDWLIKKKKKCIRDPKEERKKPVADRGIC